MKRAAIIFLAMAILPHGLRGTAVAGHPLGTEDAGQVGKGNVEVELNYESAHFAGGRRESALGNVYTLGIARNASLEQRTPHVLYPRAPEPNCGGRYIIPPMCGK